MKSILYWNVFTSSFIIFILNCLVQISSKYISEHYDDNVYEHSNYNIDNNIYDEDLVYATLSKGIKYMFKSIQSNKLNISDYNDDDKNKAFTLNPGLVTILEPKCLSTSNAAIRQGIPVIYYETCYVLILMDNLDVKNGNHIVATFQNFLTELYYNSFNISLENKKITIEGDYKIFHSFQYNKQESLFNIPSLSSVFQNQMAKMGEKLHQTFFEQIGNMTKESNLEGFLRSVFNVLYNQGPFTNMTYVGDTSKQVTYISYSNPILNHVVLTKDIIFLGSITVNFDYAIDFDLNCNEGNFVLFNFEFNKEKPIHTQYKFQPENLDDEIKDSIINHFKIQFVNSTETYKRMGMNTL